MELAAFTTRWPRALGELTTPQAWHSRATLETELDWSDAVKNGVRDLLRHGGFKPNGRNKPCNEYIRAAVSKDRFPWINPAVDATNLGVLHGGLPISTVDADLLTEPLEVRIAEAGTRYVFNPSGQQIDVSGLLCLHDDNGPCSNSVKDSQRAKTTEASVRTLTLVWGTRALPGRTLQVLELLEGWTAALGAESERLLIPPA